MCESVGAYSAIWVPQHEREGVLVAQPLSLVQHLAPGDGLHATLGEIVHGNVSGLGIAGKLGSENLICIDK